MNTEPILSDHLSLLNNYSKGIVKDCSKCCELTNQLQDLVIENSFHEWFLRKHDSDGVEKTIQVNEMKQNKVKKKIQELGCDRFDINNNPKGIRYHSPELRDPRKTKIACKKTVAYITQPSEIKTT